MNFRRSAGSLNSFLPTSSDDSMKTMGRLKEGHAVRHPCERERWCLVVENKIDDFPGEGQSSKYEEYCNKMAERGEAWLVYATLAG